jgi:hypothetical protein
MDKGKRYSVTQRIFDMIAFQADAQRDAVYAHFDAIERLEENHGLDLNAFVGIYGNDILDGTKQESRDTLANWAAVYESLATPDTVTVLSVVRERPGYPKSEFQKRFVEGEERLGCAIIGHADIVFSTEEHDGDVIYSARVTNGDIYFFGGTTIDHRVGVVIAETRSSKIAPVTKRPPKLLSEASEIVTIQLTNDTRENRDAIFNSKLVTPSNTVDYPGSLPVMLKRRFGVEKSSE